MNNILKLLSLEDSSVTITDVSITNNIKTVTVEKNLQPVFCPCCGCRMHSKSILTSTVDIPTILLRHKRLSSGIIESFNRKPKDMKRNSRGFRNFSHFRNRLLFATRKEALLLEYPKTREEILNKTGSKREPYKKK